MSATTQLLTAEDLWNLPAHGGRRELVRGEMRDMAPAGSDHGYVTVRLTIFLGNYVLDNKLGTLFAAETGFILSRDPDTVLAPDLGYVRADRAPSAEMPSGFWIGAPDLAVETVSPNESAASVDRKAQEWLAAGCRMVWVVHPRRKTITVYRSGKAGRTLGVTNTLDGEDVVPGFQIPVVKIFG
jgi:Uma2 family endonuclease